jgi:hypothetical protein
MNRENKIEYPLDIPANLRS